MLRVDWRRAFGLGCAATGLWLLASTPAAAEPYLAARAGLKCSGCHVNPSGGGLRNAAGNAYAQNALPARHLGAGDEQWLGELNRFIAIGGNLRSGASAVDYDGAPDEDPAFDVDELRLYLDVRVIPDRLSLYVDQQLAPDEGRNLEAYARLWLDPSHRWYVKAGQMYLPFGLRLEDDTAFVREISGINFDTPDDGVELGLESGPWSAQFAVSNGTGGSGETNSGKQWSLSGTYVQSRWRLGASYNFNDAGDVSRHMGALHASLRTGPVSWLTELDYIEDRGLPGGAISRWVGLLEGNWEPRRGHNLKGTLEAIEAASGFEAETQERYSLAYEYSPMQFLQLRGGARVYDGNPLDAQQNRKFYFLELHGFF
jgi:hypothetical protein